MVGFLKLDASLFFRDFGACIRFFLVLSWIRGMRILFIGEFLRDELNSSQAKNLGIFMDSIRIFAFFSGTDIQGRWSELRQR